MDEENRQSRKKKASGSSENSKKTYKIDPTDVTIGDYNIKINKNINTINGMDLLQQLYTLHNDTSLSKQEKTARLEELLKEKD